MPRIDYLRPFEDMTVEALMRTRFSVVGAVSSEYQAGFMQRLKLLLEDATPQPNPYSGGTTAADAYDAGFSDALQFLENGLLSRLSFAAQEARRIIKWEPGTAVTALEFWTAVARTHD